MITVKDAIAHVFWVMDTDSKTVEHLTNKYCAPTIRKFALFCGETEEYFDLSDMKALHQLPIFESWYFEQPRQHRSPADIVANFTEDEWWAYRDDFIIKHWDDGGKLIAGQVAAERLSQSTRQRSYNLRKLPRKVEQTRRREEKRRSVDTCHADIVAATIDRSTSEQQKEASAIQEDASLPAICASQGGNLSLPVPVLPMNTNDNGHNGWHSSSSIASTSPTFCDKTVTSVPVAVPKVVLVTSDDLAPDPIPSIDTTPLPDLEEKMTQPVPLDVNIFGPSLIRYFESTIMQLVWYYICAISLMIGGTGGLSVDGYIQWIKKGVSFTHKSLPMHLYHMLV